MAGKKYEVSFHIGAQLAGSYKGVFSSAAATMGELQRRTQSLSKAAGQVENFQKLQQRITTNQAAMLAMRKQAADAAASMSSPLGKEAQRLSKKAEDLQKKLDKDREALSKLRPELVAAGVDTKNLTSEQARLAAQSDKLSAAQARMEKSQGAVQAARDRLSWNNMKGELMGSAGIALALGAPIKVAANFEQAMAKTGAVLNASSADMAKLSEQARVLGRDTQFTATQAAQSQEMLARAGFSTEQILSAMPGMLDMAAAEGMDLAQAADIASSVLRGFNFEADQSSRVADVLAKASAATNSSIASLGDSMKYVAPIAQGLGIPFEDTAAMIGVMANAGIKGSEAGTALRASLIRLSKEPKQTAEALSKLGVSAKDARGNMRTIPSLMKELSKQMKGMGQAQKMGELSKIFGTEAASGMLAVMNAVESGDLESVTKEMYNAGGAATEMARRMNATAQGAMKRLSSATESLTIDIGNVLLPIFTEGVEKLASFASAASQFAQDHPQFTKVIVGSIAALGAFKIATTAGSIALTAAKLPFLEGIALVNKLRAAYVLADGSLLKMITSTKLVAGATKIFAGAMKILNIVLAANPILLIILAVVALAGAFMWAYYKLDWFREGVHRFIEIVKAGFTMLKDWVIKVWTIQAEAVMAVWGAVGVFFSKSWEGIKNGAVAIWGPIKSAVSSFVDWIYSVFGPLFEWVGAGFEKVGAVWGSMKDFAGAGKEKLGSAWSTAKGWVGLGGGEVAAHAAGGIFSSPHIGMVAENGKREVIVPVEDKSRGIPLWKAAGRLMGLDGFGGTKSVSTSSETHNSFSFSFQIGSAEAGIEEKIRNAVISAMNELGIQEEREAFA